MSDDERIVRGATVWHPPFYSLLTECAPAWVEVRTEVGLSLMPRRADMLLLRRKRSGADGAAKVLRGLWPLLGPVALVEFKGPTAGFRRSDLLRLVGYGVQYHEQHMAELSGPSGLTLVLLTPAWTPSLRDAVAHMQGWRLESLGGGYARIVGAWYNTIIAFIDEVCQAERDDYLRLFSRHREQSHTALRWLNARFTRMSTMENLQDLEGYEELVERLLGMLTPKERLAGLTPEEVLGHYPPEERLAGLTPEQRLAGLSSASLTDGDRAVMRKLLDDDVS
ncbi:hypothetical protein [Haliangium sp.]|uniref:hypothetical protein n=1 Tax=Haliangium sp. TaxID=2663208 RepID=UPI003D104096